jgi:threonine synthase
MEFCSTRNSALRVPLSEALFVPRAADGGVFMPRNEIDLRNYFYLMDGTTSFEDVVRSLSIEVLRSEAKPVIVEALAEAASRLHPRLRPLDEDILLLELYNGPTAAFQDFSLSFLAVLMERMRPEGKRVKLLIPTAGDSGNAAAHAFAGIEGFDIVLLCPAGSVRGLPRNHRLKAGGNTRIVAVEGDRAAVQTLATEILSSENDVKALSLATATTLNPGRFITQAFHFIYGFIQLKKRAGDIYFDIPSGNHGNFTSGILAWRWGMPVSGFIGASWRDYGGRRERGAKRGPELAREKDGAPAFSDVVNADHYERMLYLASGNPAVLRSIIYSAIIKEEEAKAAVRTAFQNHGIFMSPSTAVGYAAALSAREDFLEETGKIVLLGTSHPSKNAAELEAFLGKAPPEPESHDGIPAGSDSITLDKDPDATIPPSIDALRDVLSF